MSGLCRRCPWLTFTTMFVFMLALASTARAQSWEEMLQPVLSRNDFEKMLAALSLGEGDIATARAAYEAVLNDFTRESAAMKVHVDQLGAGGPGSWDVLNFEWWESLRRYEDRMENDVAGAIGDEAGRVRWRHAMRDDRRHRIMHELRDWQRQRHACDLVAILDPLTLSDAERARVAGIVEAYESQMDEHLRAYHRDRIMLTRGMRNYAQDPVNQKKQKEAIDSWLDLMKQAPRINDDFAPRIEEQLEPANRTAFLEGIDRSAWPEVFERDPPEIALEALRLTPDVVSDKRAAIEAMYDEYAPRRDDLRHQIVAVVRKWEKGEYPQNRELAELWKKQERGEMTRENAIPRSDELMRQHPANALLERRHDLALETVKRMRSVFTDDDLAKMPLAVRLALKMG